MNTVLAIVIVVINPLVNHRGVNIWFWMFEKPITFEAVLYGCKMALTFLAMMACISCFQIVVTPHKWMYLISYPMPKIAFLLMMISRFVPLMIDRIRQVSLVQTSMGRGLDVGPLTLKTSNGMQILKILLTWSLEESIKTAKSMRARGFGIRKRTSYFEYRLRRREHTLIFLCTLLSASILLGIITGVANMVIYPNEQGVSSNLLEYLFLAVFCLYLTMPFWSERKVW